MNPVLLTDFYKQFHIDQYPAGTKQIWTNWTPRSTRIAGQSSVINFGLQFFIRHVLQKQFDNEFFCREWWLVREHYNKVIKKTLGIENPRIDHIRKLWEYGRLPIDIYALPEGDLVPIGVPTLVLTNTHPDFFWLPNFLETMLSMYLWKPTTSATTAYRFRKVFEKWAKAAGESTDFADWQGHDFSMRGMSGADDAIMSGLGHLTSFRGTDTIPAILAANEHYGADFSCGGSVPATEHSVMCAGGQSGEFDTFKRLITEVYPKGIVSIVSDTWDLWKVLTEYVPQLKETILARDGKVVIRPDSGDPVKIICGDPDATGNAQKGVLRLLEEAVGTTGGVLNKMGAIYGDSITVERADQILGRMVNELKLKPSNMVFGIGSYTYEYVTRDTFGFAMKATAIRQADDTIVPIFKKPVTDKGGKFSHRGIPAVYGDAGEYFVKETIDPADLDKCAFQRVMSDGRLVLEASLERVRSRVRRNIERELTCLPSI